MPADLQGHLGMAGELSELSDQILTLPAVTGVIGHLPSDIAAKPDKVALSLLTFRPLLDCALQMP